MKLTHLHLLDEGLSKLTLAFPEISEEHLIHFLADHLHWSTEDEGEALQFINPN